MFTGCTGGLGRFTSRKCPWGLCLCLLFRHGTMAKECTHLCRKDGIGGSETGLPCTVGQLGTGKGVWPKWSRGVLNNMPRSWEWKVTEPLAQCLKNSRLGASLVAQWLRICLPMQGARVWALVWEDPTCRGATTPVSHNCWACASGAWAPQQERPRWREARALRWRVAPACRSWREPSRRNEDPTQP